MKPASVLFGTVVAAMALPVSAFHLDVAVSRAGGRVVTDFCLEDASGDDVCTELSVLEQIGLPQFTPLIDIETGRNVFPSDFNAEPRITGPSAIDDPGFNAAAGGLPINTTISYQARGRLEYWDPASEQWTDVPGSTRIRLIGGFQLVGGGDCGLLVCPPPTFEESFTVFTKTGIAGNPSLILDRTDSTGRLHEHLDWKLENGAGVAGGPKGAYMVEMQLTAPGLTDSEPFYIMFAKDLTTEEFATAIRSRVEAPEPEPAPAKADVPLPWPAIALATGLIGWLGVRARRVGLSSAAAVDLDRDVHQ